MAESRSIYRLTGQNLEQIRNEIARHLTSISDRLDQIEGRRGTAEIRSDLLMSGQRVREVAAPVEDDDAEIKRSAESAIQALFPVGIIIAFGDNTDPNEALGFGTWERALEGLFPVGWQSGDDVGDTGGTATHTHSVDVPNTTSGSPSSTTTAGSGSGVNVATDTHTHDVDPASFDSGSAGTLPPYSVVAFWQRTA